MSCASKGEFGSLLRSLRFVSQRKKAWKAWSSAFTVLPWPETAIVYKRMVCYGRPSHSIVLITRPSRGLDSDVRKGMCFVCVREMEEGMEGRKGGREGWREEECVWEK